MARMSFLEHLEELRKRLIWAVVGMAVIFAVCLVFSQELWDIVRRPALVAFRSIGLPDESMVQLSPVEAFQIIWMKTPLIFTVFIGSPWIGYQVWAFIAPGLYPRERRWAVPFVATTAGLFICGGIFAYYIALPSGLGFLMNVGTGHGIRAGMNVTEYYDLFVEVMLGVGVIFEIPVLLFLLTLIRVASPVFLMRHSRYAILAIVALAAVITPTGDIYNLALFATPMILLFYVGIFASYFLVLRREKRSFPWRILLKWLAIAMPVLLIAMYFIARHYQLNFINKLPFLPR